MKPDFTIIKGFIIFDTGVIQKVSEKVCVRERGETDSIIQQM